MNNKHTITGYIRSISEYQKNPLQKLIEFKFTDFLPNRNNQGVPEVESESIIRTGRNMPVLSALGKRLVHADAVPVGSITDMYLQDSAIFGKGVIWSERFPELVGRIQEMIESGNEPQFSWELFYGDSEVDDDGVLWLRDCIVAGITLVDDPAYGGRTPMLSFAEKNSEVNTMAEIRNENAAVEETAEKPVREPAMAEVVSERDRAVAEVSRLSDDLKAARQELANLRAAYAELRSFKDSLEAEARAVEIRAARKEALAEAKLEVSEGDFAEVLAMTDDAFEAFVMAGKRFAKASSGSKVVNPDPVAGNKGSKDEGSFDVSELATLIKNAR